MLDGTVQAEGISWFGYSIF